MMRRGGENTDVQNTDKSVVAGTSLLSLEINKQNAGSEKYHRSNAQRRSISSHISISADSIRIKCPNTHKREYTVDRHKSNVVG